MKRVIIESPYAGTTVEEVERNLRFLRACMKDCFMRGESPYASHGLYTQPGVLDDRIPDDRKLGIEAGFTWKDLADVTVVYADLGISEGMRKGMARAQDLGHPVEIRWLTAPGIAIEDWDSARYSTDHWGK